MESIKSTHRLLLEISALQEAARQGEREALLGRFRCINRLDVNYLPAETILNLGEVAEQFGLTDQAVIFYQMVELNSNFNSEIYFRLANRLAGLARFCDAIRVLDFITENDMGSMEAYHLRRDLTYLQAKVTQALENHLFNNLTLKLEPFQTYLFEGHICFISHQYRQAVDNFQNALACGKLDCNMLYEYGLACLFEKKIELAQNVFDNILAADPKHTLALTQLAHIRATCKENYKAAELLKKVLESSTLKHGKLTQLPPSLAQEPRLRPKHPYHRSLNRKGIPIVYIHRNMGLDPMLATPLEFSLAQTRLSNPESEIYLISDGSVNINFIHLEYIIDYYTEAHRFAQVYQHVNKSIRYDYLLFCSQRWFILKEFMLHKGFDRCIHLDSDVMVYSDLTEIDRQIGEYDFKMSAHPDFAVSGHYNFIGSQRALTGICDYLMDLYYNPPNSDDSVMRRAIWETNSGYITDMSAYEEFTQRGLGTLFNLSKVFDGSTFDANINSADGFEVQGGMKKIYWIDNRAYGKTFDTGEEIRFHALHFNENAKRYMANAYFQQPLHTAMEIDRFG